MNGIYQDMFIFDRYCERIEFFDCLIDGIGLTRARKLMIIQRNGIVNWLNSDDNRAAMTTSTSNQNALTNRNKSTDPRLENQLNKMNTN